MSTKIVKENSFDGGMGGNNGSISYAPSLSTFVSPDVSQNPNSFTSNNGNKALGTNSNTRQDVTNQQDLEKDVDDIYSKKEKPTVDDVEMGLQYELGKMIKKDKAKAKEIVLSNLKKDPKYYRNLNMLNSSEDALTMNMKESLNIKDGVNIEETKKIFADMFKAREKKYEVDSRLIDAYRDTVKRKENRMLDCKKRIL